MNYFEIINKCLIELNYREVTSWDGLTLNDHKRLKEAVKRVNLQICAGDDWPFLERMTEIRLLKGQKMFYNTVSGKINIFLVNGQEYQYSPNYKAFLVDDGLPGKYTTYGEHIYLAPHSESIICKILYNTDFSAVDENYEEKKYLENEKDESLIPEAFHESLLVYGSCLRLKGTPEHSKFKYWYSMFNDALTTMRSRCAPAKTQFAKISLLRDF